MISQAILPNNPAGIETTKAELTQQIHADLEDKDIHPVSISLNGSFIRRWLEKTLTDGGLDETDKDDLAHATNKLPDTDLSTVMKEAGSLDGAIDDFSTSHNHQTDREDIQNTPPDYLDDANTPGIDNDLSRPPSRTESVSSHRSKPDDWRPYDIPNPTWVKNMLLPLFNRDPFDDPLEADQNRRIKRAFHQQDYDHKGAISDHKVLRLCEELVESIGLSQKLHGLSTIVYSIDDNGDGQFDETEYTQLMKVLIAKTMKLRKDIVRSALLQHGQNAQKAMNEKEIAARLREYPRFLEWGWGLEYGPNGHFYDTISNNTYQNAPSLPTFSFTVMSEDARIAIKTIDDFEEKWLKLVPREPQHRAHFKSPLDIVRKLAYRYIPFKPQSAHQSRSGLDSMICIGQILLASGFPGGKLSYVSDLQEIQRYIYPALMLIKGFVFILDKMSLALGSNDEAHYYTKLNASLKRYEVNLLAKQLILQAPSDFDWDENVTRKIAKHSSIQSSVIDQRSRCYRLVSRYHNRLYEAREEARKELLNWRVCFEKIEMTNSKVPRRKLLGKNPPSVACDTA